MTNVQLDLAVGIPIVTNAAMLILFQQSVHRQLDMLSKRIDSLENRLNTLDADVKLLTGKVYELMSK